MTYNYLKWLLLFSLAVIFGFILSHFMGSGTIKENVTIIASSLAPLRTCKEKDGEQNANDYT